MSLCCVGGRTKREQEGVIQGGAFARLCARSGGAGLVLGGGGEERAAIEAAIARAGIGDRVFLLGDRGDVPDLLPAFSMFAMSSISEGYSIALLEACACALPIAATRVGGNAEIVEIGRAHV